MGNGTDITDVWLASMNKGLNLWSDFTARGRVKTMEEVRKIELISSIDILKEVEAINGGLVLNTDDGLVQFRCALLNIRKEELWQKHLSSRIDYLSGLVERCGLFDPQKMNYFFGYSDNEEEVNELNKKLWELFTGLKFEIMQFNGILEDCGLVEAHEGELTPKEESTQEVLTTTQEEICNTNYSQGLIDLFNGHIEFIRKLVGLSDDEIAEKIISWSKLTHSDKTPVVQNPMNNLKAKFAKALKENGIINCSIDRFTRKLNKSRGR